MTSPMNLDLMKHTSEAHTHPSTHEREAHRARRAALRRTFFAFVEEVFAHAPRHQHNVSLLEMPSPAHKAF